MENEKIVISILNPKVKGILKELVELGLIEIPNNHNEKIKQTYIDKLGGKNLIDIDSASIRNMLNK